MLGNLASTYRCACCLGAWHWQAPPAQMRGHFQRHSYAAAAEVPHDDTFTCTADFRCCKRRQVFHDGSGLYSCEKRKLKIEMSPSHVWLRAIDCQAFHREHMHGAHPSPNRKTRAVYLMTPRRYRVSLLTTMAGQHVPRIRQYSIHSGSKRNALLLSGYQYTTRVMLV
jgi:hypothetical protein